MGMRKGTRPAVPVQTRIVGNGTDAVVSGVHHQVDSPMQGWMNYVSFDAPLDLASGVYLMQSLSGGLHDALFMAHDGVLVTGVDLETGRTIFRRRDEAGAATTSYDPSGAE